MIYLKKITFKKDYRNLKKGFKIAFRNVTLLVGDQGCGKSTVLSLLKNNNKEVMKFDLTDAAKKVSTFYFDTESMNPRIGSMHDYTNVDGTSKGIGIGGFLSSKFQSHGEVMEIFTVGMLSKAKDCVIFLDEPEAGLSLKNQFKLIKTIEKACDQNAQLIIATHCVPLIEYFGEVFDMQIGEWVNSLKYVGSFSYLK